MKVLSVKQPWAYLLCSGIKDIENRTWKLPERYKGKRVLIHSSVKPISWDIFYDYIESLPCGNGVIQRILSENDLGTNFLTTLLTSAIIGSVVFADCVINHPSVWAEKSELGQKDEPPNDWCKPTYNWVVSEPILFDKPILDIKGKLNFWEYEPEDVIYGDILEHVLDDISI